MLRRKRLKILVGIFTTLLLFYFFQAVYAEDKIELGDITKSEISIVQRDQPAEQPSSDNEVKVGDVEDSKMSIDQGNRSAGGSQHSTPWWEDYFKLIVAGVISFIFALLLLYVKRRLGDSHE